MQMDGIDAPGGLPGKRRIQLPATLHPDPASAQGPIEQLAVWVGTDQVREHHHLKGARLRGMRPHLTHHAATPSFASTIEL